MSGRRVQACAVAACALLLAGCDPGFFKAEGTVASDGGGLGRWTSAPEGCSRDPFDGLGRAHTRSVLTLLWNDPSVKDPLRDKHRATAPDAPMRLEIARAATGYEATLETVKSVGTRLDGSVCGRLEVETAEHRAEFREGQRTLSGTVKMDCRVKGSHLTADVQFSRCDY